MFQYLEREILQPNGEVYERQKWSDWEDFSLNRRKFTALSIMHEAEESRSISQNKTYTCSSSIYPPTILYPRERTILYAWSATNFRSYDSPQHWAGMTHIERKIVVRFDTRDKNPQNVRDSAHSYQFKNSSAKRDTFRTNRISYRYDILLLAISILNPSSNSFRTTFVLLVEWRIAVLLWFP